MNKLNLSELTPEQLAEVQAQVEALQKAKKEKQLAEEKAYKELVCTTVDECFNILSDTSRSLSKIKVLIYQKFAEAEKLKGEVFNIESDKFSTTYSSADGSRRIRLGYNTIYVYDDTANTGISLINEALDEMCDSPGASALRKIVNNSLEKDKNGNLDPGRVSDLNSAALEIKNDKFDRGLEIIRNAYRRERSKQYIRAEYKNSINEWISISLSMTEAKIEEELPCTK